jgi:F0F1-type ATP synthase membrane subunit b/b'
VKEQEIEQLQHRWREETNNIHQQTKEEINNEREKLIKVTLVISLFMVILFEKKECV